MSDFEEHVAACNAPSLAPCESCYTLHDLHQLSEHEEQCRPRFQHQKDQQLAEFILPRTKYPLTAIQIRFFIARRRRTRLPLNARSIVDSLADLSMSPTFPIRFSFIVCSTRWYFPVRRSYHRLSDLAGLVLLRRYIRFRLRRQPQGLLRLLRAVVYRQDEQQ